MFLLRCFLLLCFTFQGADSFANEQSKPKVSLHIQVDRSASVFGPDPGSYPATQKRDWLYPMEKIRGLASEISRILKDSHCDYEISVGGILYNDSQWNNLEPFAQPGTPQVITQDVDNEVAASLIQQRLTNPTFADPGVMLPYGSSEILYTSTVEFIKQYRSRFANKAVVGTLLITDAGPAFERYTPEEAINEIHSVLGENTIYVPGALAYPFLGDSNREKNTASCKRDPDTVDGEGMINYNKDTHKMTYFDWSQTKVLDLHRFNRIGRGYTWDICSPNYKESLRDFLIMFLDAGSCNLRV